MTLTVKQVCERYSVSEATVLGWINQTHELKAVNVGRSANKRKPRWRIPESALVEFELSRAATPPAPKTRRRKRSTDTIEFIK